MTNGEAIDRVQYLYSKGVDSDDSRLEDQHIYSKLASARSKLITRKANKRQGLSDWNYNIIPCIELVEVDAHSCPCYPTDGCKVLRTATSLPQPLVGLHGVLIDWVSTIEGGVLISRSSREEINRVRGNRYTQNAWRYILENNHIYVYGKELPEVISVKLIAADPIEADLFPSVCDTSTPDNCTSNYDRAFRIDPDLEDACIEAAVEELITVFVKMQEDLTNDSKDSVPETSK